MNAELERIIPATSCIIVFEKGGGKMRNFITALKHRVGAGSSFGTYMAGLQRPCLESKRPADCDGIPSPDEARKDFRAAVRTAKSLPFS